MPVTSLHLNVPERSNWYSKAELKLHLRLTLVISEPHRAVCIIISDLDCVASVSFPRGWAVSAKGHRRRGSKLKLAPASEVCNWGEGYRSWTHTLTDRSDEQINSPPPPMCEEWTPPSKGPSGHLYVKREVKVLITHQIGHIYGGSMSGMKKLWDLQMYTFNCSICVWMHEPGICAWEGTFGGFFLECNKPNRHQTNTYIPDSS